jgi:Zinc knuckle
LSNSTGRRGRWKRGKKGAKKELDPMKLTCYNCQGKGHKANECPSPKIQKGKREDSKEKKSACSGKAETTNAIIVDDDSDWDAWAAIDSVDNQKPAVCLPHALLQDAYANEIAVGGDAKPNDSSDVDEGAQ